MAVKTNYAYVEKDKGYCGGMARVSGIPVAAIVDMHLKGDSLESIVVAYEDLTLSMIHSALSYYYDHKAEIDGDIGILNNPPAGFRLDGDRLIRR